MKKNKNKKADKLKQYDRKNVNRDQFFFIILIVGLWSTITKRACQFYIFKHNLYR